MPETISALLAAVQLTHAMQAQRQESWLWVLTLEAITVDVAAQVSTDRDSHCLVTALLGAKLHNRSCEAAGAF